METQKSYNVWDWIVTKTGEVRQITSDDMMDLKGEDIERLATEEEIPTAIMKNIKAIADKHAGLVSERETLNEFTQLSLLNMNTPRYSEYTTLKAMKAHSEKVNSQLLEQNRELVEALKGLIKDYPYAKGMVEIKELLTKHSKDV